MSLSSRAAAGWCAAMLSLSVGVLWCPAAASADVAPGPSGPVAAGSAVTTPEATSPTQTAVPVEGQPAATVPEAVDRTLGAVVVIILGLGVAAIALVSWLALRRISRSATGKGAPEERTHEETPAEVEDAATTAAPSNDDRMRDQP